MRNDYANESLTNGRQVLRHLLTRRYYIYFIKGTENFRVFDSLELLGLLVATVWLRFKLVSPKDDEVVLLWRERQYTGLVLWLRTKQFICIRTKECK